jgi:hypothetical protein
MTRSSPTLGRVVSLLAALSLVSGAGCARSSTTPVAGETTPQAANDCPPPALPPGTYEKRITPEDGLVEDAIGRWELITTDVADPNCYYPLGFIEYQHGEIVYTDSHPYTIDGDRIVLHGNDEPNSHYRCVVRGGGSSIQFLGGLDDGPVRGSILLLHPWLRTA